VPLGPPKRTAILLPHIRVDYIHKGRGHTVRFGGHHPVSPLPTRALRPRIAGRASKSTPLATFSGTSALGNCCWVAPGTRLGGVHTARRTPHTLWWHTWTVFSRDSVLGLPPRTAGCDRGDTTTVLRRAPGETETRRAHGRNGPFGRIEGGGTFWAARSSLQDADVRSDRMQAARYCNGPAQSAPHFRPLSHAWRQWITMLQEQCPSYRITASWLWGGSAGRWRGTRARAGYRCCRGQAAMVRNRGEHSGRLWTVSNYWPVGPAGPGRSVPASRPTPGAVVAAGLQGSHGSTTGGGHSGTTTAGGLISAPRRNQSHRQPVVAHSITVMLGIISSFLITRFSCVLRLLRSVVCFPGNFTSPFAMCKRNVRIFSETPALPFFTTSSIDGLHLFSDAAALKR